MMLRGLSNKFTVSALGLVAIAALGVASGEGCSHDWGAFEGGGGAATSSTGGLPAGGATAGGGGTSPSMGSGGATSSNGGAPGTGGASSSTTTSATTTSSSSGAGGNDDCGNGRIDPGEECDRAGDGCTNCKVDCSESGAYKDLTSFHCYWSIPDNHDYNGATTACAVDNHSTLAALSTTAELDLVGPKMPNNAWVGGKWNGSAWVWSNNEAWVYGDDQAAAVAPWTTKHGDNHFQRQCVSLNGNTAIDAQHCNDTRPSVCERVP
jgi:hypothetical protein